MNSPNHSLAVEDNRFKTLLEVPNAVAAQPDAHAVLQSISRLLSKLVPFESIVLLLMNDDNETMQLYTFADEDRQPVIDVGARLHFGNTILAKVLVMQKPLFVPDIAREVMSIPELADRIPTNWVRRSFIFPVSTARKKLGLLIFSTGRSGEFSKSDEEIMGTVAAHISTVLENAVVLEASESYRKALQQDRAELQDQRDRFRLLLDINNHIITQLDVKELLHAASVSIRDYLQNDFTGFWLFNEAGNDLECISMHFPGGKGFFDDLSVMKLNEEQIQHIKTRVSSLFGPKEMETLPAPILNALRSESIMTLSGVPLIGSVKPLGVIGIGSRKANAFSRADVDLIVQVGNQISLALENALAYGRMNVSRKRLEDMREYLEAEFHAQYNFEDIVGKSTALKKVLEQVTIVAPTDSTVLLIGETGTGKELIARAIHNLSLRRDRPFVRLNCAAIPNGLMESELFGHEKGAFTGALVQRRGRVELADEGSLFLDEIGDVDLELQPKLLRVLQEREFERLGSNRTIKVDIRLIAATHRNLHEMSQNGEFREDLYYRLNVFPIRVPALRERKDDIPLLVHYFVGLHSRRMRKCIRVIPRAVMEAMMKWHWPGNVRELQNFLERSVILSQGDTLEAPISELNRVSGETREVGGSSLQDVERETILRALRAANGKLSGPGGAAEHLGLKRTTLQRKMERLHIGKSEYQ